MNTAECPYCGYENDMTDALEYLDSDNKFDWDCQECEEEFEVHVEFNPIYSIGKIVYVECDTCGKSVRGIYRSGWVFPFPEAFKGRNLCRKCYATEYFKEMEYEQ